MNPVESAQLSVYEAEVYLRSVRRRAKAESGDTGVFRYMKSYHGLHSARDKMLILSFVNRPSSASWAAACHIQVGHNKTLHCIWRTHAALIKNNFGEVTSSQGWPTPESLLEAVKQDAIAESISAAAETYEAEVALDEAKEALQSVMVEPAPLRSV